MLRGGRGGKSRTEGGEEEDEGEEGGEGDGRGRGRGRGRGQFRRWNLILFIPSKLCCRKHCRCLPLNFRYRPRYVRRGGARASGDEGQATSGDDDHDHEGGDEVGHSRSLSND